MPPRGAIRGRFAVGRNDEDRSLIPELAFRDALDNHADGLVVISNTCSRA